jgi:hypothetical protein
LGRSLIEAGLDIISFSFDGYDAEMYEKNRQNAKFDVVLANILGFLALKKEIGSEKPFVAIEVMELDERPRDEVAVMRDAFRSRFDGLPLDKFVIRRPHNWAGMMSVGEKSGAQPQRRISCPLLWHALVVFWDGSVLPCPQDFFGVLKLGDASRENLMDIWNGEALRGLRSEMAHPESLKRVPCVECDRILRSTIAGVPVDYLGRFLSENVFGNSWLSRLLPH